MFDTVEMKNRKRRLRALQEMQGSISTPKLVYLLTLVSGISGVLICYNTTVICGVLPLLRMDWGELDEFWQTVTISVTLASAAVFSLASAIMSEKFGRRKCLLASAISFTVGPLVCALSINLPMLIGGRVVLGIGVGIASATAPVYVAECTPAHQRGHLMGWFKLLAVLGIVLASFANTTIRDDEGLDPGLIWRLSVGVASIVGLVQLIGLCFIPESPRWLAAHDMIAESKMVLMRMSRDPESANHMFDRIMESVKESKERQMNAKTKHAILVVTLMQVFHAFAGITTVVMYFGAKMLAMLGVGGNSGLWYNSIPPTIMFCMTFVGIFLVERLGRKRLLLISVALSAVSLFAMGATFTLPLNESYKWTSNTSGWEYSEDSCKAYDTCARCISMFCEFHFIEGGIYNECRSNNSTLSFNNATDEVQVLSYLDGCPNKYIWVYMVGVSLFAGFFSLGYGLVPWVMAAEIFANNSRSAGYATWVALNWFFTLILCSTFTTLVFAITPQGIFYLYGGVTTLAVIVFWVFLPETKGKTLENLEAFLKKAWLTITFGSCSAVSEF